MADETTRTLRLRPHGRSGTNEGTVDVRIGIYLDLRNPPEWRRPWVDHYRQSLELVEEADRLGCDSVWFSEHHFFEDGYLSQPLTFAAAAAARTTRARIGTAVLVAPLRPAVQIAEDAAIVDLISEGRLELGLGAGYRIPEFAAYGADASQRISTTEARVREVRRLLDGDEMTPPPVQSSVPIWVGYGSPKGARRAGLVGEGLLSIDPRLAEPYLAGWAEAGHPPAQARMAGLVNVVVADDPERAWDRLVPHFTYQLASYGRYAVEGTGFEPPPVPELQRVVPPPSDLGVFPSIAVLSPDETVALLRRRAEEMPVVDAFFWASFAGMPDDLTQRHVELLSTVVRAGVSAA
jgi:alkanesulfonate monooxygenase SsuD/methylene tetrahydromethanopterin reductase-like flavin-dependent oxidoreductase (luciferase family)